MITAPTRSAEQRVQALAYANAVRSQRAAFKRGLRSHPERALEALQRPPPGLERMLVVDLVEAIPNIGRIKAARILDHEHVHARKTLAGLTPRQRDAISTRLQGVVGKPAA